MAIVAGAPFQTKFHRNSLTLNELNLLLWGTTGTTADMGRLPTAHSTFRRGTLYQTYLLINNVESMDQGLYHLDVENWCLEMLKREDVSEVAHLFTEEQEMTRHAAVNFVWTAMVERTKDKYKERTYRYVWWDADHVAQNLHITGNALGLGVCTIGHWFDKNMNHYLGIDGISHFSVLMASAGKVTGGHWLEDRRPVISDSGV